MLTVSDYARIRYAYYVEKESMKEIERKWGHSYWTIRKALARPEPAPYQREKAKEAPVLGAYKARIEEMLAENERLPRKQRYTSRNPATGLCRGGIERAPLCRPGAQSQETACGLPAPGL